MGKQNIASLIDTQTTDAFNELTDAIRMAGFDVEWDDKSTGGFQIQAPDGYDDEEDESVLEVAYQNRVDAHAKEFIRTLASRTRLHQEVPGSIKLQDVDDPFIVQTLLEFDDIDYRMIYECSKATTTATEAFGLAVNEFEKELGEMLAKDISNRASELIEGTQQNGWVPKWDAIKCNDEYECYVYDAESDLDV